MTPEQKQQRIEQIRKDAVESYGFRNHTPAGHEPLIEQACEDIDFLLSLVESQEAPIKSLKDLHDSDCLYVTHNGACDCVYGVVVNRVAVLMRSRCVAKLRQIATDYDNVAQPNNGAAISKQALLYAARQLESVSIQE